ncbi:MAG TPA: hypothetical protein PLL64_00800 [Rhodothermales bacterium]|nr:hypothetical protein [Rhodothermales bacterium]HRR07813.1 hypothetical protein [Rhodothermales bacterium]
MRKNIIMSVWTAILLGFASVSSAQDSPIIGGDQDAHGCNPSAGYTWSALKKTCIRIFEDGIALDPQATGLPSSTRAFVVKKTGTDVKVEVFLPDATKGTLLNRVKKNKKGSEWKGGGLTLSMTGKSYKLFKNKKLIYASST